MSNQDLIHLILEKLFFGFGLSVLLVLTISLSKSEAIKEFSSKFVLYAISIIRLLGIIYFIYYLISLITFYTTTEEATFFSERATGPYALMYWLILLRPFIFCALMQLFWFKKFRNSKKQILFLTFIIFLLVLASGQNFERFVIMVTSFHRDYVPGSWTLDSLGSQIGLLYVLLWIENTLLFSGIVFITWFLSEKLNKR